MSTAHQFILLRVAAVLCGPTTAHNEPTCTPIASLAASVATDREAVETVTRFRDSVLNAVAPVQVVLPIYEHPDGDDRLFDREEALRHEDANMDFQWLNTVGGNTYVQPPAPLRLALQQAQHAILRAILHHGPASSTSEPSMEGTPPQQLASPWQTARERI